MLINIKYFLFLHQYHYKKLLRQNNFVRKNCTLIHQMKDCYYNECNFKSYVNLMQTLKLNKENSDLHNLALVHPMSNNYDRKRLFQNVSRPFDRHSITTGNFIKRQYRLSFWAVSPTVTIVLGQYDGLQCGAHPQYVGLQGDVNPRYGGGQDV